MAPRCVSTCRAGLRIWRCSESLLISEGGQRGSPGPKTCLHPQLQKRAAVVGANVFLGSPICSLLWEGTELILSLVNFLLKQLKPLHTLNFVFLYLLLLRMGLKSALR